MILDMVSLSACVRFPPFTWENQITPASFNDILANQNNPAQSFLANSNIFPRDDRRQYRSPLNLPGFQTIFQRMIML